MAINFSLQFSKSILSSGDTAESGSKGGGVGAGAGLA
jgi:hypothetical protein